MKIFKFLLNQYFWLGLIVILGFLVRLYKIDSPIADWHSWRQADTAAVTRNFIKDGFNPLIPRYDDMTAISEKPVVNPARFRFVEFPIYNIAVYPFYLLSGIDPKYDRLVSALFSLGSTVFIFFIVKKYTGVSVALLSAFVFALLPFNVFFSRTALPEPTFIFFSLGMLYFLDQWIWKSNNKLWAILGFSFTAVAFLMKPWALFFFLPLFYSLFVKNKTKKFWLTFLLLTVLAILPFIFWRLWIQQHPEGIPASNWLFNGDNIRFRPSFWWWIVSERMGREILGATGMALFFIGFIAKPKVNYFLHIWALCSFLFIVVVATGNVRHNYYQTSFVPVAAIFFAIGTIQLLRGGNLFLSRIWTITLALIIVPLSFFFTFNIVKEFYKINNPDIVEAGRFADRILPKDAVVVAPYGGDTAFLYQTNRAGFAVVALPLIELVRDFGVTSYVSTSRDDKTNWVLRHFEILEDNPKFVIADLTKLKAPLDPKDPEP